MFTLVRNNLNQGQAGQRVFNDFILRIRDRFIPATGQAPLHRLPAIVALSGCSFCNSLRDIGNLVASPMGSQHCYLRQQRGSIRRGESYRSALSLAVCGRRQQNVAPPQSLPNE